MKFRGTLRSALAALVTALIAIVGLLVPVQAANAELNCVLTNDDPRFIEGTIMEGRTVRGIPGQWEPGTTLTFIWRSWDGDLQTSSSDVFQIPAGLANKSLQLLVRGSKAGCADFTRTSETIAVSPAIDPVLSGTILTGAFVPGESLVYTIPKSDPSLTARDCKMTIQSWVWVNCGHLDLLADSAGKTLYVKNLATINGVRVQKNFAYPISGLNTLRNAPSISGVLASGRMLTANLSSQIAGTTSNIEWCSTGNTDTTSATCNKVSVGLTYTLTDADVGSQLFLRGTFNEPSGNSFVAVSALTGVVSAATSTAVAVPYIKNRYSTGPIVAQYDESWALALDSAVPAGQTSVLRSCRTTNDCSTPSVGSGYSLGVLIVGRQYFPVHLQSVDGGAIVESRGAATDRVALGQFPDATVTVTGTYKTDKTLTATNPYSAVGYGQNATWTHQWFRAGVPIAGATSISYVVAADDVGKLLWVSITMSKANYETKTFISTKQTVGPSTFTLTPTPTITGSATQGSILTAVPGTWDAIAELSYSWSVGGTASGTGPTLLVEPAMAGKTITVTVTGSKPGYTTVSKNSVATAAVPYLDFALSPTPTIEGAPSVGVTLTALLGEWDPGVSFAYQWLSNTTAISGATGPSWVFTSDHIGKRISVKVTASKVGYNGVVRTSAQTVAGYAGLNPTPVPTITGELLEGETLSSELGIWAEGVGISYQWLRNGSPVAGEIDSTYQLTKADVGAKISLRVTGSKAGYLSVSKTSVESSPVIGLLTPPSASTIEGTMAVGKVVSVTTNGWGTGHTFTYQWYRNSAEIVGATERLYVIDIADLNAGLSVRVTASKPGFQSLSVLSAERGPVTPGTLTAPTPSFTGTIAVGKVLTAKTGTWTIGTRLTYQWLRAGKPIAGANKPTYKLSALDKKKAISLRVTGSKVGYNLVAKVSSARNVP